MSETSYVPILDFILSGISYMLLALQSILF